MVQLFSLGPGQRIGHYVIESRLGSGTESDVFLARDSLLGRRVALKTPRSRRQGEMRGVQEARMVARLEHPHIVRVYQAGRYQGVWFIAYEYVSGGSLYQFVSQGGCIPVQAALELVLQSATGLAFAHGCKILHRDIKPQNLLLSGSGVVKIGDFGLALDLRGCKGSGRGAVGTPAFQAPELWAGHPHSRASDVYGLGACLYFLLVGRPPFLGSALEHLRQAHLHETPELHADVPVPVRELLFAMLHKKPESRPDSVGELAPRLAELARNPRAVTGRRQGGPRAATATPFVDGGRLAGLQAAALSGPDRAVYEAWRGHLQAGVPAVRFNTPRLPTALQLVRAGLAAAATSHQLSLSVSLDQLPVQREVAQALGFSHPEEGSRLVAALLARLGEGPQLGVLEVVSAGSLPQEQVRDLESFVAACILSGRFVVVHVHHDVASGQEGARGAVGPTGFHQLQVAKLSDTQALCEPMQCWLREATQGRYRFSMDAARAIYHLAAREQRPWAELAERAVWVSAAAGMSVVTSWAVLCAETHPGAITKVADVDLALFRPPQPWPSAAVAHFLSCLRKLHPTHIGHPLPLPRVMHLSEPELGAEDALGSIRGDTDSGEYK